MALAEIHIAPTSQHTFLEGRDRHQWLVVVVTSPSFTAGLKTAYRTFPPHNWAQTRTAASYGVAPAGAERANASWIVASSSRGCAVRRSVPSLWKQVQADVGTGVINGLTLPVVIVTTWGPGPQCRLGRLGGVPFQARL